MGEWSVEGALTSASMSLPGLGWLALILMGAKRLDGGVWNNSHQRS